MTPADQYRNLAEDLQTRARNEPTPYLRAEWERLAYWHELLAQQAEKNARIETIYEPILRGA